MSSSTKSWRDVIDDVDAAIIDGYQSGFPVEPRPFRSIGKQFEIEEAAVVSRIERLQHHDIVRRFGPVLNPPVIGSSTLAAVKAPPDRFEDIVAVINEYKQVNHNYARNHEWNVWFVVTAGSREKRDRIIADIESRIDRPVLVLPMHTDYYINLEFPVVNTDRFARESVGDERIDGAGGPDGSTDETHSTVRPSTPVARRTAASVTRISEEAKTDLTSFEADVLLNIQNGFPLSTTPYADLATSLDAESTDVIRTIKRLLETGCIKRIGCVLDHRTTGFDANCMVVWDVPDDERDERGVAAGSLPYVTLCYHRPRRPEHDWSYNLFTMIHGRDADAVDAKIDELASSYLPVEHERLYSTETLKQTGARYDEIICAD